MKEATLERASYLKELRLFLEEICCDLCRFQHVTQSGARAEDVRISQEVYLGTPGAFADIQVKAPDVPPYFVEIKYGYPPDKVIRHLQRKYGVRTAVNGDASKLILVIDSGCCRNWPEIEADIKRSLHPGLEHEIWTEERLLELVSEQFGLRIDSLAEENLMEIRDAIDKAKGRHSLFRRLLHG
jgi:adenylate cyclase